MTHRLPRVGGEQLGVDQTLQAHLSGTEAQLLADALHPEVPRQDHGADNTSRPLITSDGDEPTQELGPQPAALELILDQ